MALPRIAPYDLPEVSGAPRAPWAPDPARLVLLVHDMQRYFLSPFGDVPPLPQVVRNIASLADAARRAGVPVIYTAQKGDQFRPDRGLQADLWGPGMRAIPEHEQIVPDLTPQPEDIVLVKHRYSAFQRSNLDNLMRARGRDQIAITGVYAHIGCLATAVEAFQRDVQPFAVRDAQADFDARRHADAMGWINATCGVVTDSAALLSVLKAAV